MFNPSGPLLLPLPPLQNLAAGSKAVLAIPVGPTYQNLQLFCADAGGTAATKTEIEDGITSARLTINGKEKWNMTGPELVMMAEFKNDGVVQNGCLPLYFNAPWMEIETGYDKDPLGGFVNKDGPAWGTAGLNSVQLEVVIAAAGDGAEVVNMQVLAQQTADTELGAHIIILRHTRSFGSAATDRIIDLPRGVGASGQPLILNAIHISDANIDTVEVLADRQRIWFASPSQIHQQYALNPFGVRRTPQTGWCHLDFTGFRNRQGDALELSMRDLELALTFGSSPSDYDILLECVDVQPHAAIR